MCSCEGHLLPGVTWEQNQVTLFSKIILQNMQFSMGLFHSCIFTWNNRKMLSLVPAVINYAIVWPHLEDTSAYILTTLSQYKLSTGCFTLIQEASPEVKYPRLVAKHPQLNNFRPVCILILHRMLYYLEDRVCTDVSATFCKVLNLNCIQHNQIKLILFHSLLIYIFI